MNDKDRIAEVRDMWFFFWCCMVAVLECMLASYALTIIFG